MTLLDWLVEDHARMGMTTSCCISSTSEQLLAAVARRPKWPHAHYNLREFIGTRIPMRDAAFHTFEFAHYLRRFHH